MIHKSPFILATLILTALAITGCKKDKSVAVSTEPTVTYPDSISFHEFDPIISITSIDSFTYQYPYYDCGRPNPDQGTDIYELDINQDSIIDYYVSVSHWFMWQSNMSPCNNFQYRMSILGVEGMSEIARDEDNSALTRCYTQDEQINSGSASVWLSYSTEVNISHMVTNNAPYVGLRLKNGSSYNYAWLKLKISDEPHTFKLQLLAYGYNNTLSNSILAGQEH